MVRPMEATATCCPLKRSSALKGKPYSRPKEARPLAAVQVAHMGSQLKDHTNCSLDCKVRPSVKKLMKRSKRQLYKACNTPRPTQRRRGTPSMCRPLFHRDAEVHLLPHTHLFRDSSSLCSPAWPGLTEYTRQARLPLCLCQD